MHRMCTPQRTGHEMCTPQITDSVVASLKLDMVPVHAMLFNFMKAATLRAAAELQPAMITSQAGI